MSSNKRFLIDLFLRHSSSVAGEMSSWLIRLYLVVHGFEHSLKPKRNRLKRLQKVPFWEVQGENLPEIYSGLEVVALILNNQPPIRFHQDFALHVRCGCLAQVLDTQGQLIRHISASEERRAPKEPDGSSLKAKQ